MVKNNYSSYFKLLDAGWERFNKAHPGVNPTYCLVSEDVENFLESEQIAFLCPIVTDTELKPQSICLVHVAV